MYMGTYGLPRRAGGALPATGFVASSCVYRTPPSAFLFANPAAASASEGAAMTAGASPAARSEQSTPCQPFSHKQKRAIHAPWPSSH